MSLAATLYPLEPRKLSPELASILLFFDRLHMLPDIDWESRRSNIMKRLVDELGPSIERQDPERLQISKRVETSERGETTSFSFPGTRTSPSCQNLLEHLLYLKHMEEFERELEPLSMAGLIGRIPMTLERSHSDLPVTGHVRSYLRGDISHTVAQTIRFSPGVICVNEVPEIEETLPQINDIALESGELEKWTHVVGYVAGVANYASIAAFSLSLHLPLLAIDRRMHTAMSSVLQFFGAESPATDESMDAFRVFEQSLTLRFPAVTPRSFEAVLHLRDEINRHGELQELQHHLQAEVIANTVTGKEPKSVEKYVKGVLEPDLRRIEGAIKGRWATFSKHIYEESVTGLWKPALGFAASGFYLGTPLVGLLLAFASIIFSAEKKTQRDLRASSGNFEQLAYLVELRRRLKNENT